MSSPSRAQGGPQSALRLFLPEEQTDASGSFCGLTPQMTISEFYKEWFLPIVLKGERNASPSTVKLYEDTVRWWQQLTGDPSICQIDHFTLAGFKERLRGATFRRSKIGPTYPVKPSTVVKHERNMRAILARVGPSPDADRPAAELIDRPLALKVQAPRAGRPKPCFSLAQSKAIAAASEEMREPAVIDCPPPDFWRGVIATAFVTGVRRSTIFAIEREWLVQRDDGWWIEFSMESVPKTHKWKDCALPDWLATVLIKFPGRSRRLFPVGCCGRHLDRLHGQLQIAAGIAPDRLLGWNGWRRTHDVQMALLGAKFAKEVARLALDHGDSRTTTTHYCDVENLIRRQLPPLWDGRAGPDRQRRLFH